MPRLSRIVPITIAVIFLFFGLASANQFDVGSALETIRADYEAGLINQDHAALWMAYSLFDGEKLPQKYYHTKMDVAGLAGYPSSWFCGTPAVEALRRMLPDVTPEVRAEIESYLIVGQSTPRKSIGPDKADFPDAANLPNVHYTEHFAIRWGDSYTANMDDIEFWGQILEDEVWATEIVDWGYQPIAYSDQYYVDFYIGNSGDGAPHIDFSGAYTTVYYDSWPQSMPYVVFHPSILDYDASIQEISAHEFFHTIQFTHAIVDGCWYFMGEDETWFVEATATWAQGTVYPDFNNYIYYIYDWAEDPQKPLTDNSYGTAAPYGRVIWARYLYEHIDGLDTIYDIWNSCYYNGTLYANNEYLKGSGRNWRDTFMDFMAKVVLLDFEDGNHMPSFDVVKRVTSYPYVQDSVSASFQPYTNGLNIYEIRATGSDDPALNIRFRGDDVGTKKEWGVGVLKVAGGSAPELQIVDIPATKGNNDFTVNGLGTTYDYMYLLVSPVCGTKNGENSRYNYYLEMTRGDDPFQEGGDDDDATDDDAVDDDVADDDVSSDDCENFCDHIEDCSLAGDLGMDSRADCLDMCDQMNGNALECVLDANGCGDVEDCLNISGGGGGGDDDGGCGC